MRTYSELIRFKTFEERFEYLKLNGKVGRETFGFDRWLNQQLYNSDLWKSVKNEVIIRDNGCDLGIEDRDIKTRIYVHHMNPIKKEDIVRRADIVLNPEYLICTCHKTHNAIHYGDIELANSGIYVPRRPNDTCPWRNSK